MHAVIPYNTNLSDMKTLQSNPLGNMLIMREPFEVNGNLPSKFADKWFLYTTSIFIGAPIQGVTGQSRGDQIRKVTHFQPQKRLKLLFFGTAGIKELKKGTLFRKPIS